jgi:arsenate reductase
MITIYHNPRCSKSREALSLAQQFADSQRLTLDVIDYQKTPLTLSQLANVKKLLGSTAREMIRENEDEYAALGLDHADEDELLRAIADCPKLLQRPIIVWNNRAVIGRPPERVLQWLATGD